jgi:Uma2 family endonuclease
MASAAVKPRVSVAEYLAFERAAETKHEYRDGEIIAMPGVKRPHDLIAMNLIFELMGRLRQSPHEVHGPEMRVCVEPDGLYTYPDISIFRAEPKVLDSYQDTLLDPCVIFEILSPSTEDYDRGEKFRRYRRVASLREYVLVAQDRIRVERYVRGAGRWKKTVLERGEDVLVLESVGCEVPVGAIYTRVPLTGARNPAET